MPISTYKNKLIINNKTMLTLKEAIKKLKKERANIKDIIITADNKHLIYYTAQNTTPTDTKLLKTL